MTKTQLETESAPGSIGVEVTPGHLQRLLKLGTATVYEAQAQRGSIASEIRPIDPAMKLVGAALTGHLHPRNDQGRSGPCRRPHQLRQVTAAKT